MNHIELAEKCDEIRSALKVALYRVDLPPLVAIALCVDIDRMNIEGKFDEMWP